MKVFVLVEGQSEKALLERWAPRAFPGHQFLIRPHQGKGAIPRLVRAPPPKRQRGLLDQLPATLRAYAASCSSDEAVLVLIDADEDNCEELKNRLLDVATQVCPRLRVVFRIAIEETEAFYLGDLKALKAAFPQSDIVRARDLEPDSRPPQGTAEIFAEIVGDGALRKVEWAEIMGSKLTTKPGESRSRSFQKLHDGIRKLVTAMAKPKRKRAKSWKARYSSQRQRAGRR